MGLDQDFAVTFPRGQYPNLKAGMEIGTTGTAPIKAGDKLGLIKVTYNNDVIAQRDLVALKAVPEGGIFRRLFDQAILVFKK